ncbi:MAG: T9SS type A sorting domain-containing protein [Chitinispirillaceae bacterium]|nr:T9SS type A sorting domain-containing protein [Chitinispirillaceae bacterium]
MKHPTLYKVALFFLSVFFPIYAALLENFENGNITNSLSGKTVAYSDRNDDGNSDILNGTLVEGTKNIYTVQPASGQGAPDGTSQNGLRIDFKFGTEKPFDGMHYYGKCVGIRSDLSYTASGCLDITGATGIQFKAKASSAMQVRVLIPMMKVTDKGYHRRTVSVDTTWKTFHVSLDTLYQPTWADRIGFDDRLVQCLQWEIITEDNEKLTEGKFWLDDISIEGYEINNPQLITGPDSTYETRPVFGWKPHSGAVSYTLQIDTVSTFTSGALISAIVSETSFTPLVGLSFGKKYWRIKADNSNYSMTAFFRLLDSHIPVLIPIEDTTVQRQPTFTWKRGLTPASQYHIQIWYGSSFNISNYFRDSATVTDTFYTIRKNLGLDSVFYWRVRGDGSAFSKPDSFRVIDGRIPVTIDVPSPAHTRRPVLRWHPATVPVTTFTVEIKNENIIGTIYQGTTSDTFFEVPVDLPLRTIYWKVKGDDSRWSREKSFTILHTSDLDLISPEPTLDTTVCLRWHKPPVPIQFYKIKVSRNRSFDDYFIDSAMVMDTFYLWKNRAVFTTGTFYWQIYAQDTIRSTIDSFIVFDKRVPRIIPYIPKVSTISTPVLTWHPGTGVTTNTIQIADTISFNNILISIPTADTFYRVTVPLNEGTWYWRVKGNLLDTYYSLIDSFTIQHSNVPVISRYGGIVTENKRPFFSWKKVAEAKSYRLLLANNASFTNAAIFTLEDSTFTPQADLAEGPWYWKVSCDLDFNLYCQPDSIIIDVIVNARSDLPVRRFSITQKKNGVIIECPHSLVADAITIYNLSGRIIAAPSVTDGTNQLIWRYTDQGGNRIPYGAYIMQINTSEGVKVHRFTFSR